MLEDRIGLLTLASKQTWFVSRGRRRGEAGFDRYKEKKKVVLQAVILGESGFFPGAQSCNLGKNVLQL